MQVILLKDIKNLGKKYDIKKVADGYAQNFLIPQELAKPANSDAVAKIETIKKNEETKAENELKKIEILAEKIDGREIVIPAKITKDDKIYGSISKEKIAEILEKDGIKIDSKQIKLNSPIKEIGEFSVAIRFDHGLEAEIIISVIPE
ncbi:MAG: 50S ribosomal protein L9 [Parcubacteria group bacterium]|nr:50S ribosomal protein L9 [Parcubacteria group bacterium]